MKSRYRYTVYVQDWDDRLYYQDREQAWEAYGRLATEHHGVVLAVDGMVLARD